MLRNFTPRIYQEAILHTAAMHNTLVVLPTGLGKTAIAMLVAAQRLKMYTTSKIIILAPTRPLCEQHKKTFENHLRECTLLSGFIRPDKRNDLFRDAQIIISTPQGMENDLINNTISLKDVSLLVFDEAHHAVGDYSYVWIAKKYLQDAKYPKILALTASPGADLDKIQEVCTNLFIERIEARTDEDPDVQPYIKRIKQEKVYVTFPESCQLIHRALQACYMNKLLQIKQKGFIQTTELSKAELIRLQGTLAGELRSGVDFDVMRSLSLLAEALKVHHALELIESQGITQVYTYIQRIIDSARVSKVKAVRNLAADPYFKKAWLLAEQLIQEGKEHPKLTKLRELVASSLQKMIIFTQFRDTGAEIVAALQKIPGAIPKLFVGQQKKGETGMSQKEQQQMLEAFHKDAFNILVCTSVGEEGLDIPAVDVVIFYEPIPSAIRQIQRRGRTGRHGEGKMILLITKGTRDEAYQWSAYHKEKRMMRTIRSLGSSLQLHKPTQQKLTGFDQKIKIIADAREKSSGIIKELIDLGVDVSMHSLESADYLCAADVGIEFKTAEDFVNSIVDGRLLSQIKEMVTMFNKPILIVQADRDMYSVRNVHPNAIRGMISTIALSFGIPLLYTKDPKDTAALLLTIAKREQGKDRDVQFHQKRTWSDKEYQEFIISSLPGIGKKTAIQLLKCFGSVAGVINASKEELEQVPGIGQKMADRLLKLLRESY